MSPAIKMVTARIEPPSSTGKISLIGIWIESLLYGINCVMYGLCMYSLLHRAKPVTRWWVLVTSTVVFVLCTVHVGASLQQLLDAFVYAPTNVPDYSTVYWLDDATTLRTLKDAVYVTLVHYGWNDMTAEACVTIDEIWRLYVVFLCDWRVIIFPIILMVGRNGCLYVSIASSGPVLPHLILSSWVIGLALNIVVSGGIIARLWWIGRTIASLTANATNRFASSIYLIIESGVGSAVCGTTVAALFVSDSPFTFSSLDISAQLLVLNQLLIVVQAQKTSPYRTWPSAN